MNQANKLTLSVTPLIFLAMCGIGTFAYTCVAKWNEPEQYSVCWEAGILAAICYGFIMIHTNQLNIHSITFDEHENSRTKNLVK